MQRIYAVRGAITVDGDVRQSIVEATQRLLKELLARNDVEPDDVVSIVFTMTDDLHAEFPAAAARLMGLDSIPLLCARELDVQSSLAVPRCIRVMVHLYADRRPEPVYLDGAARLLDPPDPV
jgi:chorismate mutase